MSQQINEIISNLVDAVKQNKIVNNLVDAIKQNKIDEAEIIYNQLEELVGEKAAEELFSKIEITLLED